MDFPHDERVKNVKDQYMFGPSLMVAPVTSYGARSREVYLPAGADWVDFHTGDRYRGGAPVVVQAPLYRIPVFVKEGAVLATGPVTQYVDEKPDAPLLLQVYAGASGETSLYEDDGVTNAYARGEYSRIPVSYDDKTGVVTIGERVGKYEGMPARREFRVRVLRAGVAPAADLDAFDKSVSYDGKPVAIKL
jgi:alpha-D-xyloside xylohydrolase